jgi:hypothetical protein
MEEAQAATGSVGGEAQATRCCCGRGGGESSGWPGRDGRYAGVEEVETSHPSSVGRDLKRAVRIRVR